MAKGGRATALPRFHRNLCRFQTSLCLLRLERGVDPHIAPQKAGSSLSPENSLLQITALWPFHSSPFSKSWGPGAGGAGRSGGPGLEANRGSRAKGTDWEPGGSEAVTEGTTGCAQGHGEGGPLTPGLGAHPLTTSPPQSAESLCPRRWPSGQCSGPRDMEWSSGIDYSPATPTDAAADCPHRPQSCGIHPAPYLVGVIFLHSRLAVILVGQEMESRDVSFPYPMHCLARPGRARETGLGGGGMCQVLAGKVCSARTTE